MNMTRDEHSHMPSDGPGLRAPVASPGRQKCTLSSALSSFEACAPPCAGLLEALHNETPPSEPALSPTSKLHAAYEPISEAELLADGLIEPVSGAGPWTSAQIQPHGHVLLY